MRESSGFKGRREEYTEATRQALLSAGREVFRREGFQASGIEAISRAARVTRGAFYHHFEDKRALFDAVVTQLQSETAVRIEKSARKQAAVVERLWAGIETYLDACQEPEYGRIVVHEGPVVLGDRRFREIEEAYPMALLLATLRALEARGQLVFPDIELLCRLIDAMICKIALLAPEAGQPEAVRRDGRTAIATMLQGLGVPPPSGAA